MMTLIIVLWTVLTILMTMRTTDKKMGKFDGVIYIIMFFSIVSVGMVVDLFLL